MIPEDERAREGNQELSNEGRVEDIQEALPKTDSEKTKEGVLILDEAYILFPSRLQKVFERFLKHK